MLFATLIMSMIAHHHKRNCLIKGLFFQKCLPKILWANHILLFLSCVLGLNHGIPLRFALANLKARMNLSNVDQFSSFPSLARNLQFFWFSEWFNLLFEFIFLYISHLLNPLILFLLGFFSFRRKELVPHQRSHLMQRFWIWHTITHTHIILYIPRLVFYLDFSYGICVKIFFFCLDSDTETFSSKQRSCKEKSSQEKGVSHQWIKVEKISYIIVKINITSDTLHKCAVLLQ